MTDPRTSREKPLKPYGDRLSLSHALWFQLIMADGETLGEKINREYVPEPMPAPQKVSIEQFEADMKEARKSR